MYSLIEQVLLLSGEIGIDLALRSPSQSIIIIPLISGQTG
jgi:hypothetical protein